MNFFKNILASALGTLMAFALMFVLFLLLIFAFAASGEDKPEIEDNSVLKIKLEGAWKERAVKGNFSLGNALAGNEEGMALDEFIKTLSYAKTDDKVKGIYLEVNSIAAAPSTLLDIRRALADFKSSGKWIVAYSENYSQGGYYLASAANEVYLYPTGSFDWRGMNTEIMFYKKMLDNLGIEVQVVRGPNNKFKSAVEPFIYEAMSPENKAQIETFMSDIWRIMLEGISQDRSVSVAQLNGWADSLSLSTPKQAEASGLVNGLKYYDEVMTLVKTKLGMDASTPDEDVHFTEYSDYTATVEDPEKEAGLKKVAVVYAVGDIESGEGDDQTIGSERIANALKEAREDDRVAAIVLRVNSPGGSALASDVIWRETQLIKQSGKKFVVSMGDYAASGGYYIACGADKIYANANTITGSIGVFGLIPNMQKFWNDKIGITFDQYKTNPHADLMSLNKPMDEVQARTMQAMVVDIYNDFISKVAEGRNMDVAKVDSIGQGRVWSGEDARNLGLVDEIGNLNDAIAAAAQMAGLSDYKVKDLPAPIDPFQKFMEELTGKKAEETLKQILGERYQLYKQAERFTKLQGTQARMPFVMQMN